MFNPNQQPVSVESKEMVKYELVDPTSNPLVQGAVKQLVAQYPEVFIKGWYEDLLESDLSNPNNKVAIAKDGDKVVGVLSLVRGREGKNELDWLATEPSLSGFTKYKISNKLFTAIFDSLNEGDEFFWFANAEGSSVAATDEANPTGKDLDFGKALKPARSIYSDMEEKGLHGIQHELVLDKWGKGNHANRYFGVIKK